MPVEIRELIIRATISRESEEIPESVESSDKENREEIISACVEQVLKIIERTRER